MGRDKRSERRGEKVTVMRLAVMQTDAWRALRPVSQAMYIWLRLEWNGSNDPSKNNNGELRFSLRQASEAMGVKSLTTVAKAFHDLQAKGFIRVTEGASLGSSGMAKSPSYELTELPIKGKRGAGSNCFRAWNPLNQFQVLSAKPNNPLGIGGKTKPCPENWDSPVLETRTVLRDNADIGPFPSQKIGRFGAKLP